MRLQRILVAVDGSDNSQAAVAWAAGLAEATGAEVVAVHAVGLLEPVEVGRDEIARQLDTEWTSALDALGARARRVLRDGEPAIAVLAAADEEDADLVVLGTRGAGGHPHDLGSTSAEVVQRSPRPVVVVPLP
jgi:nucleotide-binding universal stress UspA family protein